MKQLFQSMFLYVMSVIYIALVFYFSWIVYYNPELLKDYYYSGTLILFTTAVSIGAFWLLPPLFRKIKSKRRTNTVL